MLIETRKTIKPTSDDLKAFAWNRTRKILRSAANKYKILNLNYTRGLPFLEKKRRAANS